MTITDISALERYSDDALVATFAQRRRDCSRSLEWSLPSAAALGGHDLAGAGLVATEEHPLHILVNEAAERIRCPRLVSHVWSKELPGDCLLQLADGIRIASPEFCLLQMTRKTKLPILAAIAMELVGCYGRSWRSERGFFDRRPAASIEGLIAFARENKGVFGSRKMRTAVELAMPGSRSPMETAVALCLTLPAELGGCNFAKPQLNYQITPSHSLRRLCGQAHYFADLCWPKHRVILEYNGYAYHSSNQAVDRDLARASELRAMGWDVVWTTSGQLKGHRTRELLYAQLAQALGEESPSREPEMDYARERLFIDLLNW